MATVTVTDKIPVEISGVSVTGRAYNGKAIDCSIAGDKGHGESPGCRGLCVPIGPAPASGNGGAVFEVTFTPSDTNYDTATVNVSVTVAKATPTLTAPTAGTTPLAT